MAWHCKACGQELDRARTDPISGGWRCPRCGSRIDLDSTEVAAPEAAATERAAEAAGGPADTVFQPALMMESIMDELEEDPPSAQAPPEGEPGTEALSTDPSALPAPFLELDVEAYLLVLGATPGQERRALVRARTDFGRSGADVVLEDPSVSARHFQIEAFGKEFFLRDLESRNGTFLNGSKIRYSQLLPGDQITAGKTSLIFRTSDDQIDRG